MTMKDEWSIAYWPFYLSISINKGSVMAIDG